MNKKLAQLALQLTEALTEFKKLENIVTEAQSRTREAEPTAYDLMAIGSVLHSLYQGMENILKRIVREIDVNNPITNANWHRELVEITAQEIPGVRPKVLEPETKEAAFRYLAFRHTFRNLYGFELDWGRMKPLLAGAPAMIGQFSTDVERFIAFLEMMANAER